MATDRFDKVKTYYEKGLWNVNRVRDAVRKGWISAAQYIVLTGQKNEEDGDGVFAPGQNQ